MSFVLGGLEVTTNEKEIKAYYHFITTHYKAEEQVELRAIKATSGAIDRLFTREESKFLNFCTKWSGKAHVYCGVNPRVSQRVTRQVFFVVDLDKPQEGDLEQLKKRTEYVVSSGSGFHGYWLANGSVTLGSFTTGDSSDSVRNRVQSRNAAAIKQLSDKFAGKLDPAVSDPERVLRVPGTLNLKNNQLAKWVTIPEGVKENEKFTCWFRGLDTTSTIQSSSVVDTRIPEKFRSCLKNDDAFNRIWSGRQALASPSERDWYIANYVKDKGFTKEEAFTILTNGRNDEKAERKQYIQRTIEKAYLGQEPVNEDVGRKLTFLGTEIFDNVQEVTWLVDQLIPENSVSFIAGDKGTTKSWLALETAMSVAMGRDVCGKYKVKQGNVLYLQLEDGLAIVAPRYHKLTRGYNTKPDHDKFKVYVGSEVKFDNVEIFEEIKVIIKDFKPILVVIDTLAQSHSGEENSAKEMSAVINRFKAIRDEFSATVLIVHHVKKGMDQTKKEMRGSSVIKAGAEAILTIDYDSANGMSATHVYTKNSQEFGFVYRLEDTIQNGKPVVRVVI
jgi:hypothetical protein